MNTIFRNPRGLESVNLSLEDLRDLILNGGEDFWCVGSGDGCVETTIDDNIVTLSLILKEPYGFLLLYGKYESTDDFVSISSSDYTNTVKTYLGGDSWIVPTAFFVNRQQALEAVEDFCRDGQMSKSVTWGELAEQQWEFGN